MSWRRPRTAAILFIAAIAGCYHCPSHSGTGRDGRTLQAPADQVKAAVADVPHARRLPVDEDETGNVTTGMRREVSSPWNWLLRWRFGVGKSRVEARVVPQDETTTRLVAPGLSPWERRPLRHMGRCGNAPAPKRRE